jgi:arginine exporter protein ArgO
MSEKTKLFLTILFRYVVVALLARLVNFGVFTQDQAEAFTPWLVESIVTLGVPAFIAWLAHFAAKSRLTQVKAAAILPPEEASIERINEVAALLKKGDANA